GKSCRASTNAPRRPILRGMQLQGAERDFVRIDKKTLWTAAVAAALVLPMLGWGSWKLASMRSADALQTAAAAPAQRAGVFAARRRERVSEPSRRDEEPLDSL